MALIRWQPFQEMNSLQRDMNRLFDGLEPMQKSMKQSFIPLAEMLETEDAIYLKVEIPGMNPNDLDVQVTRDNVMISGERQTESKLRQNSTVHSEFSYGKFSRVIALPAPVNNNDVKGDYLNGIITLELPKAKQENQSVKVNLKSDNPHSLTESQSPSKSNDTNSDVNSEVKTANKPEGGYGNTPDLWNESEHSEVETSAN